MIFCADNSLEYLLPRTEVLEHLNCRTINLFPEELRSRMIPFNNDNDLLRIPGLFETGYMNDGNKQWDLIKDNWRFRISSVLTSGNCNTRAYWLLNHTYQDSDEYYIINQNGTISSLNKNLGCGVRIVFKLINN